MTESIKRVLRKATKDGLETIRIDGVEWVRQRSGWVKRFAWAQDPDACIRFTELGVETTK